MIQVGFGYELLMLMCFDDWIYVFDYGEFYKKNIFFLYFGVEDYEDYYQFIDDVDWIMFVFYIVVVEVIWKVIFYFVRL